MKKNFTRGLKLRGYGIHTYPHIVGTHTIRFGLIRCIDILGSAAASKPQYSNEIQNKEEIWLWKGQIIN